MYQVEYKITLDFTSKKEFIAFQEDHSIVAAIEEECDSFNGPRCSWEIVSEKRVKE